MILKKEYIFKFWKYGKILHVKPMLNQKISAKELKQYSESRNVKKTHRHYYFKKN